MIELLRFLAVRAVPGLEEATETTYRRSLLLDHGSAIVEGEKVVGMLSIRDLMRVVLEDSTPRGA